jgi:hypothetical protein
VLKDVDFSSVELRCYELKRKEMNAKEELFCIRCLLDSNLTKSEKARLEYRRKKLTGELVHSKTKTLRCIERIVRLLHRKIREGS